MFARLLTFALQMVGVLWMFIAGGWAVYHYDRLPHGWPNYRVNVLFFHPTIRFPDSIGARLAAADGNLKTCTANVSTLNGALAAQNKAVLALKASGDQMSRSAQTATQRARDASRAANALAAKIMAEKVPANEDELATCRRADTILREGGQ